jgi:hypothetical protein
MALSLRCFVHLSSLLEFHQAWYLQRWCSHSYRRRRSHAARARASRHTRHGCAHPYDHCRAWSGIGTDVIESGAAANVSLETTPSPGRMDRSVFRMMLDDFLR